MDNIDIKLLELLQKNARMTISELSKKLNLSRPSVSERMLRLQEQGIIEEFSVRLSLKAIGRHIILFIQLVLLKVDPLSFEGIVSKDDDILECHRVTGNTDYLIKAAVNDMDSMRKLIDRLMLLGDVVTSVVLMSPAPYRHVIPKIKDIVR